MGDCESRKFAMPVRLRSVAPVCAGAKMPSIGGYLAVGLLAVGRESHNIQSAHCIGLSSCHLMVKIIAR